MRELLEKKLNRIEQLELEMSDPQVMSDHVQMAALAREFGMLNRLAALYKRYHAIGLELDQLASFQDSADRDEREFAKVEIPLAIRDRDQVWNDLMIECARQSESITVSNRSRCVMEIRAGTGGGESSLFVRDLFMMYQRHGDARGWEMEVLDLATTNVGGFRNLSIGVTGESAFFDLALESGGHRVQRVPDTENRGRVHSSLVTVAVMAEPTDIEVNLQSSDYRKETFRASGPGGQKVNKIDSAVRLTHIETGIVVSIQDEKSQHKNFAQALRLLKSRIFDFKQRTESAIRAEERKSLIGSGDRSQRIRTYNYPENRVTDHRIKLTIHRLDQVMAGKLDLLTIPLRNQEKK